MDIVVTLILPLVIGVAADALLGDPPRMPHLIVAFGRMISFLEKHWNAGVSRRRKGTAAVLLLTLPTFLLSALLLWGAYRISPWLGVPLSSLCVFYSLAGRTLIVEVREVFRAADRSLEEGRRQVARIVGRDTSALDEQEVRTAALETLAENLSDGIIAPMFWYLLLGVPGMLTYKMINTLDSMIGYRTEKYADFGRTAAKTDDVVNYVPARLTAVLMTLSMFRKGLFSFIRRYARLHLSPNSGYPESALAGILDCRFGGPHDYFGERIEKPFIGEQEKRLETRDMEKAVRVNVRSELLMLALMLLIYFISMIL